MRILLVEDDPEYAYLIKRMLSLEDSESFEIVNAHLVSEARQLLGESSFDAILLDLSLPDSQGLESFKQVVEQAPTTPIVVLTAIESEALALRAVQEGAQDYLVKIQINNKVLLRAVRFAVERQQARSVLQRLTLLDDLTGLYNRRGFTTLAEKFLQLGRRNKTPVMLLFADLDGLKHINDQYGHAEGDSALVKVANLLRRTFREADVVARLSGDEFAVIGMEADPSNGEVVSARLVENLRLLNSGSSCPYSITISFGITHFDPQNPRPLDELLTQADAAMYEQKNLKRQTQDCEAH